LGFFFFVHFNCSQISNLNPFNMFIQLKNKIIFLKLIIFLLLSGPSGDFYPITE